jgi:hypothetical protein
LDYRVGITSAGLFTKYAGGFLKPQNTPPDVNGDQNTLPEDAARETENKLFKEQALPQIHALMDAYPNSAIIFLIIPYSPSISPLEGGKISWVSPGDRYLATLLEKIDGVHVVYTQQVFEDYYEKYKVLPRGSFNSAFNFGHLNKYGHMAVAQALTDALVEILK